MNAFIESPEAISVIFKISRCLHLPNSHILLLGSPGSGKREYLQLSAILNNLIIIEPDIKKFGDRSGFRQSLRAALKAAVMKKDKLIFLVSDEIHQDLLYQDYLNFYEFEMMQDEEFMNSLIQIYKTNVENN